MSGAYTLVCRAGFPGEPHVAGKLDGAAVAPGACYPWRLATPLSEVHAHLAEDAAPVVLFADAPVLEGAPPVRKALQLLERAPRAAAVTFGCQALGSVYGEAAAQAGGQGLRQRIGLISAAPSWWLAVKREALEAGGFFSTPYTTLEFALCALCDAWHAAGQAVARVDTHQITFDVHAWVGGLLQQNAVRLAEDYARYAAGGTGAAERVPPQLRVAMRGVWAGQPAPAVPAREARPLFSLLCPAYKAAFFEELLASVAGQTFDDWELRVRIDGPPAADASRLRHALAAYADDPRIHWAEQPNAGTGPTRARLAEEAQGRFLLCIDDDDLLPPEALARFAAAFVAHPDAAVLRAGTRLFGLVDHYLRPRPRLSINGMTCDLFEVNQPFAIRREVYDALGGFEGDPDFGGAGEDTAFFLRADAAEAPTYLIDEPLYLRRLSTHNQSLLYTGEQFQAHLRNLVRAHAPDGWQLERSGFQERGAFIAQTLTLMQPGQPARIECPTAYFNYYTLGESTHTIIDLELTSLCNADCTFCPRDALARSARFIDLALVEQLAAELRAAGTRRRVVLCGVGESTLHPDLPRIVSLLSAAGAEVCMTSNAVHLPADLFRTLAANGLAQLNVSVNAATAETHKAVMRSGKLGRVEANVARIIEVLRGQQVPTEVNVSFVLHADNAHEVDAFIEKWRDSGVAQIFIHPLNNRAGLLDGRLAPYDASKVARRYAHDPRVVVDLFDFGLENEGLCAVAQSVDFITVDGRVPLCVLDHEERHVIGRIPREPLRKIHLNKIARYRRGDFNAFCRQCSFCPSALRADSVSCTS